MIALVTSAMAQYDGAHLPFTGANLGSWTAIGIGALALGAVLYRIGRA